MQDGRQNEMNFTLIQKKEYFWLYFVFK